MKKIPLLFLQPFIILSCLQTGPNILAESPGQTDLTYNSRQNIQPDQSVLPIEENQIRTESFTPEQIIRAYREAYPEKINEITYRNNDWALKIYGQWYYWAEGRLLTEEHVLHKEDFNSHIFYQYSENLPPFRELSRETKDRIDSMLKERKTVPLQRHAGFLNSLWRIYDRDTSWARVKTTFFLGYKLQIHRDLLEDLANVEEEIQRRMLVDTELSDFVNSLSRIDGYNWRKIAETETLSVHSYGTALDLILNHSGREEVYWLWTQNKGVKFYDVPYEKRFSPPDAFIKAFEKYGFIWGGKWLLYDTIHFEYRPEILILNGL